MKNLNVFFTNFIKYLLLILACNIFVVLSLTVNFKLHESFKLTDEEYVQMYNMGVKNGSQATLIDIAKTIDSLGNKDLAIKLLDLKENHKDYTKK